MAKATPVDPGGSSLNSGSATAAAGGAAVSVSAAGWVQAECSRSSGAIRATAGTKARDGNGVRIIGITGWDVKEKIYAGSGATGIDFKINQKWA